MKHSLDRKMDRILERENSGRIKKGIRNRALRKLFANRLSVLGFIIFIVILVMCLGAPLFTQYSATKVDLRNILSPPTSSHIFGTDKIGTYGPESSTEAVFPSAWGWEAPLWPQSWVYRWGLWQVIRAAGLTGSS